ncbi:MULTISPECIES: anti-repressor SinI family protein [Virgibacillus]|uniref:Anti-repressor SinI n=2 Tax=Virgibacillus TaxID=84406 RepID=A0A024Q9S1_9BACI|nr:MULTISPECIES: anti-repressor SinI family protein [Virgibacillus]MYL40246.1 DNA-binding anti-repressor SinI [Virgibacillus massiliensis]GGJ60525.1 hypothetical protein GCM10007111_23270 [Virgibacillus kapii]CDQ38987.1 Anti-repressor SinI [Virgibacillus massiliensis]
MKQVSLDSEWVELIKQAKSMGIPITDIQLFLRHTRKGKNT